MHKTILAGLALLFAGASYAQTAGVVTLTANRTSSTGSFAPVLTWSTNPTARSCVASGGWSGTKSAAGTQTLAAITSSKSYTLTCTWGTGSATVNWTPPTTNSDGSALTNLARFKVVYGTSASSLTQSVIVDDITRRSTTLSSLAPGPWYFAVRAVNTSNVESANSNVASKTVAGATAAKTVNVTITASGLRTTSTNVWDYRRKPNGVLARVSVVGQIALGKPCDSSFKVAQSHYAVNRADVSLYATPVSTTLVAFCEAN